MRPCFDSLMNSQTRRSFLKSAAVAALATTVPPDVEAATGETPKAKVKLGVASYSYWHFRDPKVTIAQVIEKAGALGVSGVDVSHRQMDIPEKEPLTDAHRAHLRELRRHALH